MRWVEWGKEVVGKWRQLYLNINKKYIKKINKERKLKKEKNLYTPMYITVLFPIPKCWKQLKCPSVNESIKKLWHIYIMEYYAAERKEHLPFVTAGWNWRALC